MPPVSMVPNRLARPGYRDDARKLHIGMDADTGEIIAATLTTNDVDDASQVGPLLDQVEGPSFIGDGAYDQEHAYRTVDGCRATEVFVAVHVLNQMQSCLRQQRIRPKP